MTNEQIMPEIIRIINDNVRYNRDHDGEKIRITIPILKEFEPYLDFTDTSKIALRDFNFHKKTDFTDMIKAMGESAVNELCEASALYEFCGIVDMDKINFERFYERKGQKWYCCPYCGKALFPVRDDTLIRNLSYRCKACKHDIEVNI